MKTRTLLTLLVGITCALCLATSAGAISLSVDVYAKDHSYAGGSGTFLDTGLDLSAGDWLSVSVAEDDLWSAGAADRVSNANGLTGIPPYGGGNYGLYGAFHYGSLVAYIGSGTYFKAGTSFSGAVSDSGRLFLGYWDSNNHDNFGFITAAVATANAPVPEPGTMLLLGTGLVGLAGYGRKRKTT